MAYDELLFEKKNIYKEADEAKLEAIMAYSKGYMKYLDNAKTEREAVVETVRMAEENGYAAWNPGDAIVEGGKYYHNNRGKSLFLFRIGTADVAKEGVRIIASHIDSPRIDLKQNPLYEDGNMAFLKTHYYGGIKKYQWTAIPLALHGVVVMGDGTSVNINIGEDDGDPVFYINDILPHLGQKQSEQPLGKAISGEALNIVVGSIPVKGEESGAIKRNVLRLLNEKYGLKEEDFISAELSAVPAEKAKDVGFDRGLIAAYGHDDRVCSYPAFTALFDEKSDRQTVLVALADKEEIGSYGVTGMQCYVMMDILDAIANAKGCNAALMRTKSKCLSADVTAAFDPNFAEVFEPKNSSYLSCGAALCKYTGARGKSGSSDASAEFVGWVRKLLADNQIIWQTAELGKVDEGGGGTVAMFIANLNIDTVDFGVPVISMHAPYEVVSKADVYSTYEAFCAFVR